MIRCIMAEGVFLPFNFDLINHHPVKECCAELLSYWIIFCVFIDWVLLFFPKFTLLGYAHFLHKMNCFHCHGHSVSFYGSVWFYYFSTAATFSNELAHPTTHYFLKIPYDCYVLLWMSNLMTHNPPYVRRFFAVIFKNSCSKWVWLWVIIFMFLNLIYFYYLLWLQCTRMN